MTSLFIAFLSFILGLVFFFKGHKSGPPWDD